MVKITVELVRKRSEHNEGEIGTLEELSLHQENIEKIEYLEQWCPRLTILYLQHNLISKLEHLGKLKRLVYLNLAMNNIERVENLEGCESLEKLDLTVNFVGELTSVESLKHNRFLKTLYLTGNPCTDIAGYKDFCIAVLPRLECLDGESITRTRRLRAYQYFPDRDLIKENEDEYWKKREAQRMENEKKYQSLSCLDDPNDQRPDEEKMKEFWSEMCDNSPETRVHLATQAHRNQKETKPDPNFKPKRVYKCLDKDGSPCNVNEAKIPFVYHDNDADITLEVQVYKYLDTSLIDVDVHPKYVKMLIKGKILQLVLMEEIVAEKSTVKRSQTTGHLFISMPKLHGKIVPIKVEQKENEKKNAELKKQSNLNTGSSKRELLEIGSSMSDMDFSRIVVDSREVSEDALVSHYRKQQPVTREKTPSKDFIENPEVPPLE